MTMIHRWSLVLSGLLVMTASTVQAQPIYGGGYWGSGYGYGGYGGGAGGGQTVQGNVAQGMGVYAAGAGQYNLATAQAQAINAKTAQQWNQYIYQSRLESSRNYHAKMTRDKDRVGKGAEAVRTRLRDHPTSVDISRGDALNVALDELADPKVFPNAVNAGHKVKVGGESIRDIPFSYASAAISISVHQLTRGGAPAILREREEFAPDREALRAIAAELRQEGEELGTHKPETIEKAKTQILATKAKIETVLPQGSPGRLAADKYIKALYGFARMLETPAVGVLLAGVEKRPEATLGDLLGFMAAYNLRFGVAETSRQKEVYAQIYPMLAQLRSEVAGHSGTTSPTPTIDQEAPMALFDGVSYDHLNGKTATPPRPR